MSGIKILSAFWDIALRESTGPYGIQYVTHFDRCCRYGNELTMTATQVRHLQRLVGSLKPEIKYYVCIMNKTFASHKQRMYFSVHYTDEFLSPFLTIAIDNLHIKLSGTSIHSQVRLIKGTDGRATITTNWTRFVRAARISQGDIIVFEFKPRQNTLCLAVHRL